MNDFGLILIVIINVPTRHSYWLFQSVTILLERYLVSMMIIREKFDYLLVFLDSLFCKDKEDVFFDCNIFQSKILLLHSSLESLLLRQFVNFTSDRIGITNVKSFCFDSFFEG